jgi:hypothetical protein
MGKLSDEIKKDKKGIGSDLTDMLIESNLNKLFYLPEVPEQELAMIKMQYDQKGGDRYGLHASAMLASEKDFCYRQQVLSLFFKQDQGENIPVGLKRIFQEGTTIGEKWQRLFLRGNLGKPEWMDKSEFKKEYDLSYTPDAIIVINKKKYVVEIKSQNTFAFKHATSHPSGKKQLKLYMWLTGIPNGFVLVEDKNTQEFKVFPEVHNEADLELYIERLEMIQVYKKQFKDRKKPPKGICKNSTCKRAEACSMKDACFNIGIGRVKL